MRQINHPNLEKNLVYINDESGGTYNTNAQIILKQQC